MIKEQMDELATELDNCRDPKVLHGSIFHDNIKPVHYITDNTNLLIDEL